MSTDMLSRVADLLVDKFGTDKSAITKESTFEELDLDSLDLVEFALAVEDELGVRITDDEAADLTTLGDAVDLLQAKGAKVS